MTPSEIEAAARQRYNAVNDTFYSSAEIYDYIYNAELELAHKNVIKGTTTTTSVTSTSQYTLPSLAHSVYRIEYNGEKLKPINFRENDSLTFRNTSADGESSYYRIWGDQYWLSPAPSTANTIKLYTYDLPTVVTASTTLEAPKIFHMDIVDYCLAQMALKDENPNEYDRRMTRWSSHVTRAEQYEAKTKRTDAFGQVQDEDTMAETLLGLR